MDKEIVWTNKANTDLHNVFLKLLEKTKSIEITSKVISEVYSSVLVLSKNPEIFKLDNLKRDNQGNIRVFYKHNYRVSYLIDDNKVYILKVRHSRKRPQIF